MSYTFNNLTITDEELKALEWDIAAKNEQGDVDVNGTIDWWVKNAIAEKARRCILRICREALADKTNTILSTADKQALRQYLDNQGIVLAEISDLPENVIREIVKRANIQSAVERNAEKMAAEIQP